MGKGNRVALLSRNKTISDGVVKTADSWNSLEQVENYVENIDLPGLNTETGDVFSILTAVPSPWARGYMMNSALVRPYFTDIFQKSGACKEDVDGMDTLYAALQNEWKGLIAAIALYSSRIEIEKIVLEYTDEMDYDETTKANVLKEVDNVYQIKGAFGNMLFNEAVLWADRTKSNKEYNPPYFQLIKLDGVLIGATNPRSLVYPAAHYQKIEKSNVPFFKRGRFTDPLHHLKDADLDKLYHYVGQIKNNLEDYDKHFKKSEVNTINLKVFLSEWKQEIAKYIKYKHKGYTLRPVGVLDYFKGFNAPFSTVFNINMKIYKYKGNYLTKNVTGKLKELNPDKLLLDSKKSQLVLLKGAAFNDYLATALSATCSDGDTYHFSLPLSELGLSEFYSNLNTLLEYGKGDKNITARYIKDKNLVEVTLEVEIDGHPTPFSKLYKVKNSEVPLDTNVVLWPNFIAKNWDHYYMYSEILHNNKEVKAIPLISNKNDYEELMYSEKDESKLYYFTDDEETDDHLQQANAHLKVNYDEDKLKGSDLKYEIYYSDVPFKGIELRGNDGDFDDYNCGYILLDNSKAGENSGIINLDDNELAKVDVGIDFGSTNTTVSCRTRDNNTFIMSSNNRRRFLLGHDKNDNFNLANAHELFFFQNDDPGYFFKSSLLKHHRFRLKNTPGSFSGLVTGGFPVWEENIHIVGGDDEKVIVNVNNTKNELLHDLKWRKQDQRIKNKKAFLKMLWLLINAELFADSKRPTSLSWSYPSSMPNAVRHDLEGTYSEMVETVRPISDNKVILAQLGGDKTMEEMKVLSESEAVAEYVLTKGGVSVSTDSILINFDIGGVTSDLSILIHDPEDKRAKLVRQTSAKLAANRLSIAAKKSKDLRDCISYFAGKNHLGIKALEDFNPDASSYLLNLLFNKLEKNNIDASLFYNQCWNPDDDTLDRGETRGLFAIASYISGLLLFHAAQKVRGLIENGEIKKKKYHIKYCAFGKGGKIFEWLRNGVNEAEANRFYKDCFTLGSTIKGEELDIISSFGNYNIKENVKKEVAYGLVTKIENYKICDNSASEVIGEVGYKYKGKEISWNEIITPDMIHEFGEELEFPTNNDLPRFSLFIERYLSLVRDWDVFDPSKIKKEISKFAERKLENYVKTDEAWISNKMTANKMELKDFKLTASPFLYEGMCFLDEVLIPKLYGSSDQKKNIKPSITSVTDKIENN